MTSIYFDSSFIAKAYRVDNSCEILEWMKDTFADECIVANNQYATGPCNAADHSCRDLNTLINDEEVLEFTLNYRGKIPLQNIYNYKNDTGDLIDLKALAFAYKNRNCQILSCDRNLLMLCKDNSIEHFCFKAAMVKLDKSISGIFSDFNTSEMFKNCEDPFFALITIHDAIYVVILYVNINSRDETKKRQEYSILSYLVTKMTLDKIIEVFENAPP